MSDAKDNTISIAAARARMLPIHRYIVEHPCADLSANGGIITAAATLMRWGAIDAGGQVTERGRQIFGVPEKGEERAIEPGVFIRSTYPCAPRMMIVDVFKLESEVHMSAEWWKSGERRSIQLPRSWVDGVRYEQCSAPAGGRTK